MVGNVDSVKELTEITVGVEDDRGMAVLLVSAMLGASVEGRDGLIYVERLCVATASKVLDKEYRDDDDMDMLGAVKPSMLVKVPKDTERLEVITSCGSEDTVPLITVVV